MNLPSELRQAVEQSHGAPVEVIDDERNERYVLIRADLYERLKCIIAEEPLSDSERKQLLIDAGHRAGWDDPEMDIYNDLDPRRQK
ncbi:MAG: hypothetical protein JNG90_20135 [Planctomycetaceae bacterium]|nr:hypothetical protein [Planctomycetaceae bacterium]